MCFIVRDVQRGKGMTMYKILKWDSKRNVTWDCLGVLSFARYVMSRGIGYVGEHAVFCLESCAWFHSMNEAHKIRKCKGQRWKKSSTLSNFKMRH